MAKGKKVKSAVPAPPTEAPAPSWPCDNGKREVTRLSRSGRLVRAKWLRCMGACGKWFWSEDAVNNRMCDVCGDGRVRWALDSEKRSSSRHAPVSAWNTNR